MWILTDADIPESFFDVIQSYADDFSESEKFCIDDRNISLNKSQSIDNPLFDIVSDYPINTKVIYKNINSESLATLCVVQDNEGVKKK